MTWTALLFASLVPMSVSGAPWRAMPVGGRMDEAMVMCEEPCLQNREVRCRKVPQRLASREVMHREMHRWSKLDGGASRRDCRRQLGALLLGLQQEERESRKSVGGRRKQRRSNEQRCSVRQSQTVIAWCYPRVERDHGADRASAGAG